jgi:DNA-directed RNA polymerase specialized sigma24 family protein
MITSLNTFAELYDMYAGAIYGCISRAFTDKQTVNTVFEKAFITIFRDMDQHSPRHSTLFTWMMTIVQQEINTAQNNKAGLVGGLNSLYQIDQK